MVWLPFGAKVCESRLRVGQLGNRCNVRYAPHRYNVLGDTRMGVLAPDLGHTRCCKEIVLVFIHGVESHAQLRRPAEGPLTSR
jgi:hypothetical protein